MLRFPGCGHTRHLRAHHVRHWFHQGATDVDNLVLICGFHHRLLHDAEVRITRNSLTPYREGERLDADPILERLLPRPRPAAA